ncbi:MAG: hypothetical protein AB7V16_11355 [Vulcanibacillus sp.]
MFDVSNPYFIFLGGIFADVVGWLKWGALAGTLLTGAFAFFKYQFGDKAEREEVPRSIKWTIVGCIAGFFLLWYGQSKLDELFNLDKSLSYLIDSLKSML